jgi:hypothetical protein
MGQMLKLSAALSGWGPAEKSLAREPLVLLEAGWDDIVGLQVAQNSHPTRIADGALLITTRSSAWSHQLMLLGEHVLRAIAARVPTAGVNELRFRVGRLPLRRAAPGPRGASVRVRAALERAEAASPEEALARFRDAVERSNRSKQAQGWKACGGCGALVAPALGDTCAACGSGGVQRRAEAAARLLFEAPWLGYAGTAALVHGLKEEEYETIRAQLLTRWWGILVQARVAKRLSRDGRERLVASSYVLLHSKIPPEDIMPATVRGILGDELHDLIYAEQRKA